MKKTAGCLFAFLIAVVFGMYPLSAQENPDAGKKDETTVDDKKENGKEDKTEIKKEEKTAGEKQGTEEKQAELKKKTSDYTLGEIVVRSKALASVEDAAITTELSSDSLKSRSEKTLDQALQTVPGVRVYQGKKGQMNFDMHGFQHNSVAILVDGLPFEEIYDGGGGDISRILVMNASKIVINRGTSSALYGQRGAFGAVNVVTKKPERVFFDGGVEFDQYGGYSVNVSGGGTYKDFYLLLSASTIKSNSYEISNQLGQRDRINWFNKLVPWYVYGYTFQAAGINTLILPEYVTDRGNWNHTESTKYYVSGKAGYAITKNVEVGISTSYYQGSFNFNGFEPSAFSSYAENGLWSNPSAKNMFQNRAWQWPKDYRISVAPYVTLDFGDFNMRAMYYYTKQANVLYGWTNQAQTAMFDRGKQSEHDEESNGFYIYPSYKFTNWNKLTAVIHYRFDEYDAYKKRVRVYAPTAGSDANPNYDTPWFKTALMTAKYVTVGLEDEFKFKTNYGDVKFSLGLSYDAQKLSRNQGSRYTPLNTAILNEDVTGWLNSRARIQETSSIWGTGDSFDPVVAALYEPIKEMMKIRASFSRKVKFPTLHEYSDTADLVEQYFFTPATRIFVPLVLKLAQIKPETAYNASGGYELTFLEKALTWRQDYFYSYYENKIVSIGDPNSKVGNKRWTNIKGSDVHGLESTIGSTIGTDKLKVVEMNLSLTHVLTSAKDRLGSHAVQGERVKEVPAHQLIMQCKLDFISGTSLNLWGNSMINQIVYVQQIVTPSNLQTLYSTRVYGRKKLHDPFMMNIKVSQRIVDHFDLWVMCKNITDDYNSDPFNPGPGRTFYFGGDAEF